MKSKWKIKLDVEQPDNPTLDYAKVIYQLIYKANQLNITDLFQIMFPPQTEIFYDLTYDMEEAKNIDKIIALNKQEFIATFTSSQYKDNVHTFNKLCLLYKDDTFHDLENIQYIGTCPNRQIYAFCKIDVVYIRDKYDGKDTNFIPTTNILYNDGSIAAYNVDIRRVLDGNCVPFSNGKRVLFGGESGLFLVQKDKVISIFPDKKYFNQYCENIEDGKEKPKDIFEIDEFPMLHFSLSYDNKLIALGTQDIDHLLYDVNGLFLGSIEPVSAYPHYAMFSKDDKKIAFNSCHFYNGATIVVNVQDMQNNGQTVHHIEIDMESRVYAGVATSYGYIIDDASGYLRTRNFAGDYLWDDYLGFNITTMDITDDEKILYVGTHKGIIYKIELDYGNRSPYVIGNSNNKAIIRWLFWDQDTVLKW